MLKLNKVKRGLIQLIVLILRKFMVNLSGRKHEPVILEIPTYDGSGQAVHPSVKYFPNKWNGFQYWMAITPFPNDNNKFENPSIFASNNGLTWLEPSKLKNPIVETPQTYPDYNSDPDLFVYNETMYLIYRERKISVSPAVDTWFILTSRDGINWSEKSRIFHIPDGLIHVSPCMVHDGKQFIIYFVTFGIGIRRIICKGDPTREEDWSKPESLNIKGLFGKKYPWHLEVKFNDNCDWEILLNTSSNNIGSDSRLHYGYSNDGVNWTINSKPFIEPLYKSENHKHYKASFIKTNDIYHVWYSGRNFWGKWSTHYLTLKKFKNRLIPLNLIK